MSQLDVMNPAFQYWDVFPKTIKQSVKPGGVKVPISVRGNAPADLILHSIDEEIAVVENGWIHTGYRRGATMVLATTPSPMQSVRHIQIEVIGSAYIPDDENDDENDSENDGETGNEDDGETDGVGGDGDTTNNGNDGQNDTGNEGDSGNGDDPGGGTSNNGQGDGDGGGGDLDEGGSSDGQDDEDDDGGNNGGYGSGSGYQAGDNPADWGI